ncbi:hypothetical protein [Kutzneria chonburiensis]|uniref:Secreted protein n=1 Tax=Kutzneria chonburiensis TaxID=1483604 RepID=A0ABV6MJE1_9PSEU|nr:hypothetical protein [Kutzneria chonburiensis]
MKIRTVFARTGRAIGVVAAMLAIVAGAAVPAQAATQQFSDGFEGVPSSHWQGITEGDGVAGFDINQGLARSGANDGWLYTGTGYAAERIAVPVGGWPDKRNCSARIYAETLSYAAQVGLEIWSPNNGWVRLTGLTGWITPGSYQAITTFPVDLTGQDTVYIQAIYGNNGVVPQFVRLDDATLTCLSA